MIVVQAFVGLLFLATWIVLALHCHEVLMEVFVIYRPKWLKILLFLVSLIIWPVVFGGLLIIGIVCVIIDGVVNLFS